MENQSQSTFWIWWIVVIVGMFIISYYNFEALDESVFIHFRDPIITFTVE